MTTPNEQPVSQTALPNAEPCPFCGSTRIVKGERYFAMCVDCGATGPERNADASVGKFTGDWNTRHYPHRAELEAVARAAANCEIAEDAADVSAALESLKAKGWKA